MDYGDVVTYPLPQYLEGKLQRVQKAAAGFVTNRFAGLTDIIKLGWLPIKERTELYLLRITHKALYDPNWPSTLPIEMCERARSLRSSSTTQLVVPLQKGTLQDSAAKLFNNLPDDIRVETDYKTFMSKTSKLLMNNAKARIETQNIS